MTCRSGSLARPLFGAKRTLSIDTGLTGDYTHSCERPDLGL